MQVLQVLSLFHPRALHQSYLLPRVPVTMMLIFAGMIVPSHIMDALSRGFEVMNLFPAEAMNGYELLKTYQHAFPRAKFAVNGGINLENMGNIWH